MKKEKMTLDKIKNLETEVLTAEVVAPILHMSRRSILQAARGTPEERAKLGFKVIVVSERVLIPRRAFVEFMESGKVNLE